MAHAAAWLVGVYMYAKGCMREVGGMRFAQTGCVRGCLLCSDVCCRTPQAGMRTAGGGELGRLQHFTGVCAIYARCGRRALNEKVVKIVAAIRITPCR